MPALANGGQFGGVLPPLPSRGKQDIRQTWIDIGQALQLVHQLYVGEQDRIVGSRAHLLERCRQLAIVRRDGTEIPRARGQLGVVQTEVERLADKPNATPDNPRSTIADLVSA